MHGIWKCIDGIWKFFLHGMSLSLALPHEVKHHYWQHVLLHDSVKKNSRWRYVWCATVWLVWRCRNQSIFHEKKLNIEEAIHQILFQSWTWLFENGFNLPSLPHNRQLTSVLENIQHRFWIDIKMTIVKSRWFFTSILKSMLKTIIYISSSQNWCCFCNFFVYLLNETKLVN